MQPYKGYFIEGSTMLVHPFSPDWCVGGSVLMQGRSTSIVEITRFQLQQFTVSMRELAEWFGLELSRNRWTSVSGIDLIIMCDSEGFWRRNMDRLDNEDIGVIWARHYPRRTESQSSNSLCITLAMIITQRAASILPQDADNLPRALAATGVPREQFESVEADLNSLKS